MMCTCISSRLTGREVLCVSKVSLAWRPSAERYKVELLCRHWLITIKELHYIMYMWIACFVFALGISGLTSERAQGPHNDTAHDVRGNICDKRHILKYVFHVTYFNIPWQCINTALDQ